MAKKPKQLITEASKRTNPYNEEHRLFKKLTRLFSGPIVNYKAQGERAHRRKLDKYASKFKSASGQQFKKNAYSPFENLQANIMANQNRAERYQDFDQMEFTPELSSALDVYADEMTTSTTLQDIVRVDCYNDEIKSTLEELFDKILNLENNLFTWCRTMCKYGDVFIYLDIDEKEGLKDAIMLPAGEVERLEGEDPTNPNYIQFQWNSGGLTLENWQVSHFRIIGNDKYVPYGTSVLEPARRIWRQLTLLEDAMMAYRIVRSPERRVFYIDVGNIAPHDVEQYMQKVMTQMKRNQVVDPKTGRVDLRYNPMSIDEDYFMPVRGDTSSRIDTLPGGQYTGDIDDVKYLRDKLFSAIKIPQSYLASGEGADEDKATLAQKDIRFARTIQRLQRAVLTELYKISLIHLSILGFKNEDLVNFELSLNNPSKIAEMQELEHWRSKFDVAGSAVEGFFSKRWIATNIFGLTEEEQERNFREMFFDEQLKGALAAAAAEAESGGDMGGGMGDMEGVDDMGDMDMDSLEAEEDDSMLLSAPAKREEGKPTHRMGETTTARSKGKTYKPKRGSDGRKHQGRKKNAIAASGVQGGTSNTNRQSIRDQIGLPSASISGSIYEDKQAQIEDIFNQYEKDVSNLSTYSNTVEAGKATMNSSKMNRETRHLLEQLRERKTDVK